MRIAVVNITAGGMSGGYKKYLRNTLPRMADNPGVDEILCVGHRSLNLADWFETRPNLYFANCDSFRILRSSINVDLWKHLDGFSPDIIFIPTERFLKFRKVPVVNMVQNMEPLAYSDRNNPASEKIRNFIRKKVSLSAFNSSRRIIAVSQYVKKFLISELGIPETKIGVVYHGFSDAGTAQSRPESVPQEYKDNFVFTAGSIRPARGLEDIINAVILLAEKQINVRLVIAGYTAPNMLRYRSSLQNIISKNSVHDRVIWSGALTSQEMNWCYKNSIAFIMTSRVESFPIIAVEVMAAGCICISANNSCLPEIFADAATFYPPRNYTFLAEAIAKILNFSDQKLNEVSQKALKRRAFFSWDNCAAQTVNELAKGLL